MVLISAPHCGEEQRCRSTYPLDQAQRTHNVVRQKGQSPNLNQATKRKQDNSVCLPPGRCVTARATTHKSSERRTRRVSHLHTTPPMGGSDGRTSVCRWATDNRTWSWSVARQILASNLCANNAKIQIRNINTNKIRELVCVNERTTNLGVKKLELGKERKEKGI